ncbi:MAG: serine/threonine protein kinase, partial [Planctomycetes bacterium]|nr:serine/threonine protein kinase [Planctomycetota bacterium]
MAEPDPWTGRRLGPYRIVRELGRGGMGVVLHAVDEDLGRAVALKLLAPALVADPEGLARFRREAAAAAGVDHPGVVRVYAAGEEDGQPWCAMELVEGRPLDRILDEERVPPERSARIVRDAALAVEAAHGLGVIHRDLKPANLLVEPLDRVRVADFGLARALDSRLTGAGALLGTPAYMSPEQALDAARAGPASDVWSLGATLYEALTLVPPFGSDDPLQV